MRRDDEDGFTLIELLIVVAVLGIIMSAITGSLIAVIRTTGATAARTSQSHDAQLLSTWLVPDLQSAGGASGINPGAAPFGVPIPATGCAAGTTAIGSLQLLWNDQDSATSYDATYLLDTSSPSGFVLRRTLKVTVGTSPSTSSSMVVVHNLEDPSDTLPAGSPHKYPVCYVSAAGRTTVTINTLVKGQATRGSDQYAFDVTAQTRTPGGIRPPPPPLALNSVVSEDIAPQDGWVDTIVATFNQPMGCTGDCDPSMWDITGQPGTGATTVHPIRIVPSITSIELTLTPIFTCGLSQGCPSNNWPVPRDTKAPGLRVALRTPNGVSGVSGGASFSPTTVLDGMPPVLGTAASRDTDGDGRMDSIALTFSEAVPPPAKDSFSIEAAPAGTAIRYDPDPAAITGSGAAYNLPVTPSTAPDTVAALMRIRVSANAVNDTSGNRSAAGNLMVDDGMAPALDPAAPPVAQDRDGNGKVDHVVVSFGEDLVTAPYSASTTWTLSNAPSGGTLSLSAVAGRQATLTLNEGSGPPDTSAGAGFTLALPPDPTNPNGVRDAAGNQSRFTATAVRDGMAPALLSIATPAPASGAAPSTPGKIEVGDALDITFSEPVASVPASLIMVVEDSTAGTAFTLPGLLSSFTVGSNSHYTVQQLNCTMVTSAPAAAVVRLTVASCTAGLALPVAGPDSGSAQIAATAGDSTGNRPPAPPPTVALPLALYF